MRIIIHFYVHGVSEISVTRLCYRIQKHLSFSSREKLLTPHEPEKGTCKKYMQVWVLAVGIKMLLLCFFIVSHSILIFFPSSWSEHRSYQILKSA